MNDSKKSSSIISIILNILINNFLEMKEKYSIINFTIMLEKKNHSIS